MTVYNKNQSKKITISCVVCFSSLVKPIISKNRSEKTAIKIVDKMIAHFLIERVKSFLIKKLKSKRLCK